VPRLRMSGSILLLPLYACARATCLSTALRLRRTKSSMSWR